MIGLSESTVAPGEEQAFGQPTRLPDRAICVFDGYNDRTNLKPRTTAMSTSDSSTPQGEPSPEELKRALKAFRKRLKLTRLDAESKLGGGPMSSGPGWGIVAITPPDQYPRSVWDALVKQGKLKVDGHGLYSLAE